MEKLKVALEDRPVDVELARYKRMFEAACSALASIGDALGVEPDEGGAEPILSAIAELKTAHAHRSEQEPVIDLSKVRHEDKCRYWDDETFCDCGADSYALLEWYRNNKAAPVQQVDLTDEEQLELARSSVGKSRHWLVAAVIAAYKEKNK